MGRQAGVVAFMLATLVEDDEVVFGATLVGAADAAERAARQALRLEEDRLVLRRRLGHTDHRDDLALQRLGADVDPDRAVEHACALAGDLGNQLVGLVESFDFIGREQRLFLAVYAEQDPAAVQAGLVGQRTHGFH